MSELRKSVNNVVSIRFYVWPHLITKVRRASDENIIKIAAILLSDESYVIQMNMIEEIIS
jgi:hypothetical protein